MMIDNSSSAIISAAMFIILKWPVVEIIKSFWPD